MRLIDADKLEVISYKDTEGREDCGALMDWRCR